MDHYTQPPVKDTHAANFAVPKGAIDTHIHLFSGNKPMVSGSIYKTADATPEMVMDMHRAIGVNRAVYVSGGGYGRNPTHLMATLRQYPDYFRGVIVPPEGLSDAQLEEMEAIGVRGVRYVSVRRGGGGDGHLAPIMPELSARVHELGWNVQFYPHGEDILDYADQLMALPNTIVLDHFGSVPAALGTDQPAFRKVLEMMETGRVWVKISGPMRCTLTEFPYAEVTPFAKELVARFPERLVWGTDWPHVNFNDRVMPNDGGLMDLMAEWVPDEAVRKLILVDNAEKLYRF